MADTTRVLAQGRSAQSGNQDKDLKLLPLSLESWSKLPHKHTDLDAVRSELRTLTADRKLRIGENEVTLSAVLSNAAGTSRIHVFRAGSREYVLVSHRSKSGETLSFQTGECMPHREIGGMTCELGNGWTVQRASGKAGGRVKLVQVEGNNVREETLKPVPGALPDRK